MASVAIIGMGAISSAGSEAAEGYSVVRSGKDGVTPLDLFESGLKVPPLCSQIRDLPEGMSAPNRTSTMALSAAYEALSGFDGRQGLRLGLVAATTVAGMTRSERFYEQLKKDPAILKHAGIELAYHEPASLTGFLCEKTGARNFYTLSTACSTGLHAAGMAKRLVEKGSCDLCLAVGADALSVLTVRGFSSLMLIDPSGCKPFDSMRAGISLGEGAGALLFASVKAADRLHAEPIAYMSGWGASSDCHHMTAPHPDGVGAFMSMKAAVAEAGIDASDIDMVATHGTATPDNDKSEIAAMRSFFGTLPPFFSIKRTIGHTLAASGIIETVYSLLAMKEGFVLPTAGFSVLDEAIGAVPAKSGTRNIRHLLKNAFGFGGNNCSAVFTSKGI
jgi:3-oxoacyl-[acyl-carrier-protein] synthase I